MDRLPFLYLVDWLIRHACIIGRSGCGKTNLNYLLALSAIRHGVPVWFFDYLKSDYRHLNRFTRIDVWDAHSLKFNFLQPPSFVNAEFWYVIFATVFCKVNRLLDGSRSMLLEALFALLRDFSVLQGGTHYPDFVDLKDKIASMVKKGRSRSGQYRDSLLNRMDAYLLTNPELYSSSQGYPIEELASRSTVFELKYSDEMQALFQLLMLNFALLFHRMAVGNRGSALRNVVIIDEAHWAAPPGYNQAIGFSPLSTLMAQAREFGIGLVLSSQSAALEDCAFVNSRLKVCMGLGSGGDIERVRRAFALTGKQAAHISRLDVGEAIIRVPHVAEPFLIDIPRVPLE